MNMPVKSYELHESCNMIIKWKKFKNQSDLVPGLYCADHGNLVKWLSLDLARELIEYGVQEETT